MNFLFRILVPLAWLQLSTAVSSASVVNRGYVFVKNGGSGGSFDYGGDGFSASGGLYLGNWAAFIGPPGRGCLTCPTGTIVSVNGIITGGDIGASDYGRLQFFGPNVALVSELVVTEFTFTGALCPNPPPGMQPVCRDLTGSGQVEIRSRFGYDPFLTNPDFASIQSLTYVFSTPEPSFAPMITLAIAFAATYRIRASSKASRLCKSGIT